MERITNPAEALHSLLCNAIDGSQISNDQKAKAILSAFNDCLAHGVPVNIFQEQLAMLLLQAACNGLPLEKRAAYMLSLAEKLATTAAELEAQAEAAQEAKKPA